ncbi:hypothetical protein D3C81_2092370 [compost metagenome]
MTGSILALERWRIASYGSPIIKAISGSSDSTSIADSVRRAAPTSAKTPRRQPTRCINFIVGPHPRRFPESTAQADGAGHYARDR